jgi:RNA polymerase sigma-70 factor, ECF subfamily
MSRASDVADDQLRLIFACCHPALEISSQVALTLHTLGSHTIAEIAQSFLVNETAVHEQISSAQRILPHTDIPSIIPGDDDLSARIEGVQRVIYSIFNKGYSVPSNHVLPHSVLCLEAIRLGRLMSALLPNEAEVHGLLSLMLLHDARRPARYDQFGRPVVLSDQDRSRWNQAKIEEGLESLRHSTKLKRPGPYQIQAAISAVHMMASSASETDWVCIARLYGELYDLAPSPIVELNRVVAISFVEGPTSALGLLQPLMEDPRLSSYQPLHAARADLLNRAGDLEAAAKAYDLAAALSTNPAERSELERRRKALGVHSANLGQAPGRPNIEAFGREPAG